jgi:replicative DNA helicase
VKFYCARRPEKLNPDEFQRLAGAAQRLDGDITPARIWAMAEVTKRTHGLDLIVVDYDQLVVEAGMDHKSDDDSVFRHQRSFVFRAKRLAEWVDICSLLLSQLRKLSPAVQKGAQPHLDDIWGDSAVRNTPHTILWVSRDFFTKGMDKKHERAARVYVLKSRNGRTGVVPLEFDPERLRFLDQPPSEKD